MRGGIVLLLLVVSARSCWRSTMWRPWAFACPDSTTANEARRPPSLAAFSEEALAFSTWTKALWHCALNATTSAALSDANIAPPLLLLQAAPPCVASMQAAQQWTPGKE